LGGLTPGHVRRGRLCQSLSLCLCAGWVAACADRDVSGDAKLAVEWLVGVPEALAATRR